MHPAGMYSLPLVFFILIYQADCVMVVGMGDDPSLGEFERLLLSMKTTARKELILLHPDRSVAPGSTREWLKVKMITMLLLRLAKQ